MCIGERREFIRCERPTLNSIQHEPIHHVVCPVRDVTVARFVQENAAYVRGEAGFPGLEVIAQSESDSHIADYA